MIGDDGVPRPPPDLDQRQLVVEVLPTETRLYRFHDKLCLAVFDRAIDALSMSAREGNLRDQAWFYELMDLYQVRLLPND